MLRTSRTKRLGATAYLEIPRVSTAALKSGASRPRYAAIGLDPGEATETFGNEPSTLIAILPADIGPAVTLLTLHRDGHFKSVAIGGVVLGTPRSRRIHRLRG